MEMLSMYVINIHNTISQNLICQVNIFKLKYPLQGCNTGMGGIFQNLPNGGL